MKLKKWVFVLFALALIFLLPTQAEAAIVDSGTCGDNLTWTLDDAGHLTISGTGEMKNYSIRNPAPWGYEIKTVTITNGVTSIGDYAFNDCRSLTSVTIPNSVTSFGEYAFQFCDSLTSITIPSKVTSFGNSAFRACGSLTSVTIPGSVTRIGWSVFESCSRLKSVTISSGVTSIGDQMFYNCVNLTSVTIPNSVTSIGVDSFAECSSLTSITIPSSVTSIGVSAFSNCDKLADITIPSSVTSIGNFAFHNCGSLKSITIPSSVTSIGNYMFSNCDSLTSVTIPNSVTSIGREAFAKCSSLKNITLPSSVTSIGAGAFTDCSSLKEIRFKGDAPSFGKKVFSAVTATAYYPVDNSTWTADVMQDYGGTITWVPYTPGLDNVVINKVIAHKTGNILYWDAVENGDIYQIYRLNGSSWELLKNTRSLGYKDETAKVGVKHYYKIVARNGDAKSDIKTTVSASAIRPDTKLANVVINKTIAHSSGNIMYWDAVPGADLYQVYRLRSGDSSWTLLKNTRSLGYKDETATPGIRYYYKIVARNGDVKSNIATTASTLIVRP